MKFKRLLAGIMLGTIFMLSGCATQTPTESKSTAKAIEKEWNKAYLLEDCALLPKPDYELTQSDVGNEVFSQISAGSVVYVLEEKNDGWCCVSPVNVYRYNDNYLNNPVMGWVKKNTLGYYEVFKNNIGLEIQVKKEYVPEWARDWTDANGEIWAYVMSETETEFSLSFPGASSANISKEGVKPFIMKPSVEQ